MSGGACVVLRRSYIRESMVAIPPEIHGWWRIVETGTWVPEALDDLGPAMVSSTGHDDRLRMCCLLTYVNGKPVEGGVSFRWEGAWELDPMSGRGSVVLGKDGRPRGEIRIEQGDDSALLALRCEPPDEPIEDPPSYRDERRRRW